MKVLLAQDDLSATTALQSHFTKQGCEIFTAKDQAEVFRLLESEESLHVVILDSNLIDFDFATVCERIRAASSQYPYILLLSEPGTAAAGSALAAGADDYLIKPVQENELEIHLATAKRVAEVEKRLLEDLSAVFLSKPVSAKHLVEKIRELLDGA